MQTNIGRAQAKRRKALATLDLGMDSQRPSLPRFVHIFPHAAMAIKASTLLQADATTRDGTHADARACSPRP